MDVLVRLCITKTRKPDKNNLEEGKFIWGLRVAEVSVHSQLHSSGPTVWQHSMRKGSTERSCSPHARKQNERKRRKESQGSCTLPGHTSVGPPPLPTVTTWSIQTWMDRSCYSSHNAIISPPNIPALAQVLGKHVISKPEQLQFKKIYKVTWDVALIC